MTDPLDERDRRWTHALDGLPVLAFPKWGEPAVLAEVTGIDGFYVWVVIEGEDGPLRLFWNAVRPLAPVAPLDAQNSRESR